MCLAPEAIWICKLWCTSGTSSNLQGEIMGQPTFSPQLFGKNQSKNAVYTILSSQTLQK